VLGQSSFRKRSATLVLLVFGLLLCAAWAQTESVLYSFCAQTNCTDGANPVAGLVFDQEGNLYGTTHYGGISNLDSCPSNGCGLVFKLTPTGKETASHSFCNQNFCPDGELPLAALVIDHKGNLYGTTAGGGAYGTIFDGGVVFRLTPQSKERVLYNFCTRVYYGCLDGSWPVAGLIFDLKGNLYGTTEYGGVPGGGGGGVVFKVTPEGKETVLYTFCAQNSCTDGAYPLAGLAFDQNGNLYGTTYGGGAHGLGIVFKLTPEGKETVLYSFCARTDCTDGAQPTAGLVLDQKGNLYGTTEFNGAYGYGVVFKLTPEGKETVLHSFCAQGYPCTDGANPYAALLFDQRGNLYGTTQFGGFSSSGSCYPYGCGVAFKLTPDRKETVLYTFCAQNKCADGANPQAGVIFDQKGTLYGTTAGGGAYGGGTVFKLTR
jgi:uncharacterized repeat protein (TIGR03803 family)